jgi:HEAT repeat protein
MKREIIAVAVCAFSIALLAQQPKISNTQLSVEPATDNLAAAVDRFRHSSDRLWIGYEVPALAQSHLSACSDWSNGSQIEDECCGEVRLEDDYGMNRSSSVPVEQNMDVLLRFERGELVKIRPILAGCHLDAGGVNFIWLSEVKPDESVAFLSRLVDAKSQASRAIEGALLAISLHASPEATRALEQIALSDVPSHIREQAAFWLGVQRGHDGFLSLESLKNKSTDTEFRAKLAFDFAQNSDSGAEDELLRMAKFDPEAKVREQAIFWISQKAGKKASAAITDAIQNDPETDVKRKAVFALSQLPKDESVPQLIHVAETNSNPAVRKEAFFWLGQSQDPRALAFLEQILKR